MQGKQKTCRMFAKKKKSTDSKRRGNSEANKASNQKHSSNSSSSSSSASSNPNPARRSGIFRQFTKPPTIIRANEQSNNARKRRPPRPPPPKFNNSSCVSAFSLDPPSYEEVLRADAKASRHKRAAPPLPRTSTTNEPSQKPENILLDFGFNDPNPTTAPSTFHSHEFRDLEDIFSDWNINQTSASSSNNNDNNATSIFEPSRTNGNLNWLEDDFFTSQTSVGKPSQQEVQRPVPLPRSSLAVSTSSNNNQNLADTSTRNRRNSIGNGFDDAPSLPPRPSTMNSLIENQESALVSPTIPPKPQHYADITQGLDVDLSLQRCEPHGIALFEYTASQNDELSFEINDTIVLIHRIDNDWFYGCCGALEGMFPRNFIQVVIPLPDDPEFQNEGDTLMSGPRCLAMFDYVSDSDEELSFHVGDMVSLVARINEHWLMGEFMGKSGLVPANYVRIIENLPTNASSVCEATVLHDFKAELANELNCKVGDHITIITPIDRDWVKAQNGTQVGIIPWTYLDFSI